MLKITVNSNSVEDMFENLIDMPKEVTKEAFRFYKQETPIRSGNARNKTKLKRSTNKIESNYPYAGRLDEGWSTQAPKGMTEPTIKEIEAKISQKITRLSR